MKEDIYSKALVWKDEVLVAMTNLRIIVDTFRQEKLLTMLKPIVDENELLKLKKELEISKKV